MRLGVVPIGSADGMLWLNAGRVLVRGQFAPLVSSPSLEHTRIDLTGIPDAVVGDEVVIIGRQGATINAIRSLLTAGSAKKGVRCSVEIVEDKR